MAPQTGTTDTIAKYLTTGYWTETGQPAHHWDTSADNVITVNLAGLNADGQALARAALDAWSMVADIVFRETTGRADMTLDDARTGATTNVSYDAASGRMISANVNIGTAWLDTYGTGLGSYSYQTYLHEIGHGLGLGHPATYPSGATYSSARWTNDSWQQSVMSYLDQDENPNIAAEKAYLHTPMMADIVAMQSLYGAPSGGATAGNTTYGIGGTTGTFLDQATKGGLAGHAMTIYDEGGTDTINMSNDRAAQKVSLASGGFSDTYGTTGNLGIARGTTIENFRAGSGSDQVTGNGAANGLYGNAGNDRLSGGGGDDSIYGGDGIDDLSGGSGKDRLWGDAGNDAASGNAGEDSVFGLAGNDLLHGDDGNDMVKGGDGLDKLWGEKGDDILAGEAGADRLSGDAGNDKLVGGLGADDFVFASGVDTITDFENDLDTLLLDDALWGGKPLTPTDLLRFARVSDGDVILDFGQGNKLVIANLTNLDAIVNDIEIF